MLYSLLFDVMKHFKLLTIVCTFFLALAFISCNEESDVLSEIENSKALKEQHAVTPASNYNTNGQIETSN